MTKEIIKKLNKSYLNFDQHFSVVLLKDYNPSCFYCGIEFLPKPISITLNTTRDKRENQWLIKWPAYIFNDQKGFTISKNTYLAIINDGYYPSHLYKSLVVCETIELEYRSINDDDFYYNCICYEKPVLNERVSMLIDACYNRRIKFNLANSLMMNPYIVTESELRQPTITKETSMNAITLIPTITRVIINEPAVIIFWSDDSKTIGKCMSNDEFDAEIGLAMAISKKYFEILGFDNPRGAFKKTLKKAENHTMKTIEKKDHKKLEKASKEE